MCGIAGILNFNDQIVDLGRLKKMTDTLVHRGPDGEGHWVNDKGNVGFGHRRLSIIDLSDGGHQPMHYAEERYTITYNGEIYNFIELRDFLRKKGYAFRTESDTEVVLAAYTYWGENCLDEFDGMFALAIWDEKKQEIFCARDRFGEKPFYYHLDNQQFVFASEIKAIKAINGEIEISQKSLEQFVLSGTFRPKIGETMYSGVCELEAGNFLKISAFGAFEKNKYWSLIGIEINDEITIEEAKEKYFNLFEQSVLRRLRSDVKVGSSLSGGLDSSSIVMMINRLLDEGRQQKTFSARFENFEKDEGKYIDHVVSACSNVEKHSVWPNEKDLLSVLPKLVYHQEEPFNSSSIYLQWKVMELAKQKNITVLLDGQGADEYLAGYLSLYGVFLNELYSSYNSKFNSHYYGVKELHGFKYIRDPRKEESLRMRVGRWKRKVQGKKVEFESLNERLLNLTSNGPLQKLLRYADRNSMAHSREVRLPFLNHKLVEFVFSLPRDFVLRDGWTKYIHRASLDRILPREICWRVEKVGFEPPQNKWMMNDEVKERIESQRRRYKIKEVVDFGYTSSMSWNLLLSSYYG